MDNHDLQADPVSPQGCRTGLWPGLIPAGDARGQARPKPRRLSQMTSTCVPILVRA